jgi:hypothetical protein
MSNLFNLARMTTATTGTGTITLGAAVAPWLTFAQAGVPDGTTVSYAIQDGVANSEIGQPASILLSGTTLTPQGRLTLTTAVPVLAADVTAATTIYYTPYVGNVVPIYDGTNMVPTVFSELSLALDLTAAHTGYHQSGKLFDLFVVNDAGTIRLASGPAWTNDTTRAETLSQINGILVSDASIVLRFGSASGNTITYTKRATYVGTFRASADGQTQMKFGTVAAGGGEAWFGLWNMYQRREMAARLQDNNGTWTYTTAAWRAADNSTTFRISMVRGQDEDGVFATYGNRVGPTASNAFGFIGIGLDSTTVLSTLANQAITVGNAGQGVSVSSIFAGLPGLGFHYLQALEQGDGTNANNFYTSPYNQFQALVVA